MDAASVSKLELPRKEDLRAIIFDFDGTLVDSEIIWKQVIFDLFKENHSVELTQEIMWEMTGRGIDRSVASISEILALALSEIELEALATGINEETHRRILKMDLQLGARDLIEWAYKSEIKLGICTASTNELIETYFSSQGLYEYFDVVISTAGSSFEERKPAALPYLKSLEALGVDKDQALAIEDSPSGVTSALAAGIATIAIPHEQLSNQVAVLNPTALVQDFHQILDLLSVA